MVYALNCLVRLASTTREGHQASEAYLDLSAGPVNWGYATVNLFKIYLVVVKFRETGASVRDDWFLTRLSRKVGRQLRPMMMIRHPLHSPVSVATVQVPRWLSIEPKTTRGQNKYLLYCYGLTLSCWVVLLNIGEKVCIRL